MSLSFFFFFLGDDIDLKRALHALRSIGYCNFYRANKRNNVGAPCPCKLSNPMQTSVRLEFPPTPVKSIQAMSRTLKYLHSTRQPRHVSGLNFPLFSLMPSTRLLSSSNLFLSLPCSSLLASRSWNR